MTTEERRRRRFSADFKKTQVDLIESGEVTMSEVSRRYQVKFASVRLWVNKYGSGKLPGQIIISDGKEFNRIRELEKEKKKLLELMGKMHVELAYNKELVRLAKEKLGPDFEKK